MDGFELLIPILGVIFGGLTILVPIVGITARIALKPVMESWARYRELRGNDDAVVMLERRMALMEEHLNSIDRSVQLLLEESDFRRKLEVGGSAPAALPGGSGTPES
ncbi:MAG TPA: hypothetical protein VF746_05615 [Longimicrobium sp.]|jgi:hypothetical protein